MNKIRIFFLKIRMKYFSRFAKKDDMNLILQHQGIEVGEGTIFYNPNTMNIDRSRPWMLRIGKYCKICAGTTILAHDYSRSVIRRRFGEIIGEAGKTILGDNCFIGINSIILMGSRIGNNVIVGAGSVVHGDIPDDVVVAGNPAKVICTLEEYKQKLKNKNLNSAVLYYKTFKNKYKRSPKEGEMGPFFPLFAERSAEYLKEKDISLMLNGDDVEAALEYFYTTEKMFNSYTEFKAFAEKETEEK